MNDNKASIFLESCRNSPYFKVFLIGILILLLQIPIFKIENVIRERQRTRDGAVNEVTDKWGKTQKVIGPKIVVPYLKRWMEVDKNDKKVARSAIEFATFLPETLNISGKIDCEMRHRGIYEIPVYRMNLNLKGQFARPDFEQWIIPPEDILWDRAYLSVNISDTRAITEQSVLIWNEQKIPFLPSSGEYGYNQQGIHTKMKGLLTVETSNFSIPLVLNGSMGTYFSPVGKETEVSLDSNWNAPSFQGTWLPTDRTVSEDGFNAVWKISFLGRNFPQSWRSSQNYSGQTISNVFGVNMISSVDHYKMSHRSVKYQLLFVLLTFTALWLFEVLTGMRIHLMQYLLVGAGMCIFYLLELSLSEHIGFAGAYAIASVMLILLLTFYSSAMLRTGGRAAIMGVLITLLYSFLYILLMIQDYALLFGSMALFFILALVMFLTRKINWYAATKKPLEKDA